MNYDCHIILFFQEALDNIQICKEDQKNVFSMIVAVLWLGNISFSSVNDENNVQVTVDEGMLFLHVLQFNNKFITRKFIVNNDNSIHRPWL